MGGRGGVAGIAALAACLVACGMRGPAVEPAPRYDEAFFSRLHGFLDEAERRGVVVEAQPERAIEPHAEIEVRILPRHARHP